MAIKQVLQLDSSLAIHANQIGDWIVDGRTITQNQPYLRRHRHIRRHEAVGVGRQLQQCRHLGAAGKFGIADTVCLTLPNHEVREPEEPAVEHGGLVHHRVPVVEGPFGRSRRSIQPVECECGRKGNAGHPGAEAFLQFGKVVGFVSVAQSRGARQ